MVQRLKKHSCETRLRWLNLPTLKNKRLRGDMIQVYNIVSGKHYKNLRTVDCIYLMFLTPEVIYIKCN